MSLIPGGRRVSWTPMGEAALVVELGNRIDPEILRHVWALDNALEHAPLEGLIECVPAYTTVTILFDPTVTDADQIGNRLEQLIPQIGSKPSPPSRRIEIPVCYGGEFGPDLGFVAQHNGISMDEVIQLHSEADYLVYLIGFAPGFPYLGGMSPRISAPRLSSPRLKIPMGSVGIAGDQTGIYPLATPGGWRLIGRTPISLFRPMDRPPSLLLAGDTVRFRPITEDEFRVCSERG